MIRENIEAIKWLVSVSEGNRIFLVFSICTAIIAGCLSMIPYILLYEMIKMMIEGVVTNDLLMKITVGSLMAIIGKYLLLFTSTMCSHRAAFDIQANLRRDLLEHTGKLSLGFFNNKSSGILRKIISEDIENLEIYIAHHIPDTVMSISVPFVIFCIILMEKAVLAIALIIPLILMAAALSKISKIRKNNVKEYFDNTENMNSATVEYIKAIPIIKIFNITVKSFTKFNNAIQKQIEITSKWIKQSSPYFVIFKSSLDLALPLLMILMFSTVYMEKYIDLAAYILCFVLSVSMVKPINQIFTSSNLLCALIEGAKRVNNIMEISPILDCGAKIEKHLGNNVNYDNVKFSYNTKEVLHGISFELKEHGLYAFVGESGSGKTTTAQLLVRFWDVVSGSISIGNENIQEISLDSLFQRVSFAFQDTFIIDGTIKDNICMKQTGITDAELEKVSKTVEAHDFITCLPDGYDTVVGSEGIRLSGGEKQRVCLARAIFKKTPILVLDEPTSQIDATNERKIFENLKINYPEKLIIYITHRILTATNADNIFLFDNGEIMAKGKHSDLLTKNAKYRQMWTLANKASNWSFEKRG